MQAPAESKVVQLYNELISLPYDQEARIRAIGWQLRKLQAKQPSDLHVHVALLHALLMSGDAGEAMTLAEDLWRRRDSMDSQVRLSYALCLFSLGLYERVMDWMYLFQGRTSDLQIFQVTLCCAIGSGDAAVVAQAMKSHEDIVPLAALIGEHPEFFRARQRAVRTIIEGKQVDYTVQLVPPDSETDGEIDIGIYVAGTVEERRLLEHRIDDAVAKVAAEFGVRYDLLPIVETIHDFRSHCSFDGS